MTDSERTERERRYRGPLPGEVPLSRDSRPGGVAPGVSFDPATGRVSRTGTEPADEDSADEDLGDGPSHVPDRAPSREDRRRDGRAMVPLLARALASQLEQVAGDDEQTPDRWWFTPNPDR